MTNNTQKVALLSIYDEGVKVTVEEPNCSRATAYLKRDLFERYIKRTDETIPPFGIQLGTLMDFLGLLSETGSTGAAADTCSWKYEEEGSPLELS